MSSLDNREIEVRFLEIDVEALKNRLGELGAQDKGEEILDEIIFYDTALAWRDAVGSPMIRLRSSQNGLQLSYKYYAKDTVDGTEEIEFGVDNKEAVIDFLEKLGMHPYRHQQKKCHTFVLGETVIGIDTWPNVPTFVELEGPSEAHLRETAALLNLAWDTVVLKGPRKVLEENYGIPITKLKYFTFEKTE